MSDADLREIVEEALDRCGIRRDAGWKPTAVQLAIAVVAVERAQFGALAAFRDAMKNYPSPAALGFGAMGYPAEKVKTDAIDRDP